MKQETFYVGETFEFSHGGFEFIATIEPDDSGYAPWERSDGTVDVSRVNHDYGAEYGHSKSPSEFIFHRGYRREYSYCVDIQEAMKTAIRDDWGIGADDLQSLAAKLGRAPTKREIARAAVDANIEFIRGWCADDWQYIGLIVKFADDGLQQLADSAMNSLWGIESCSGEYIRNEVAINLADALIACIPVTFENDGG